MSSTGYEEAGAGHWQLEKGARFSQSMYELMQRTFGERVVAGPAGFGPLFSLDYDEKLFRHNYAHPILVSAANGVGAKRKIASLTGRHEAVGMDLVANCVNEVLTLGAEPLFFLDYFAAGQLEPKVFSQVVEGIVAGCKQAGCTLLGGKTAQVPGSCDDGAYELAGFVVGVAESRRLIAGCKIRPGDLVAGLPSSGLHSASAEAESLVRHLFLDEAAMQWEDSLARFGIERSLADELLAPTRIYVRAVRAVLHRYTVKQVIAGIAHVTGGLVNDIARVLPDGCAVELDSSSWKRPLIFDAIQEVGGIPEEQMHRTFNMGVGMALVVAPYYTESVVRQLRRQGEEAVVIGRVVEGARRVMVF